MARPQHLCHHRRVCYTPETGKRTDWCAYCRLAEARLTSIVHICSYSAQSAGISRTSTLTTRPIPSSDAASIPASCLICHICGISPTPQHADIGQPRPRFNPMAPLHLPYVTSNSGPSGTPRLLHVCHVYSHRRDRCSPRPCDYI